MTTSKFLANKTYAIDGGTYWVQDAGADYSLQELATGTLRFEVRSGDVWSAVDPSSKNRSEIASTQQIANGTPVHVSYLMTIEPGAANTAAWLVLGQFHQNDGPTTPANSPPFSINLVGEKMAVNIGYTNAQGVASYLTVFSDTAAIVRGHSYAMDISVTFDPSGNGHLTVTRDGVRIVDYTGRLGFTTQESVYWKEGIYRAASAQTMAVDYSNLTLTTGTATAAATSSAVAGTHAVSQYSNTGALLSTTTTTTDATGAVILTKIVRADGTSEIRAAKIVGHTYTASDTVYSSTGAITKLVRTHADGTLDSQQIASANGSTVITGYDATGQLTTQTIVQASGAKTVTTYGADHVHPSTYLSYDAAGKVIVSEVFHTDGSKIIQNFGVTGHTYVADTEVYDSLGHLASITRTHADGTLDSKQVVTASATTTTAYNAAGVLVHSNVVNADGTKVVGNYGVTNHTYVSDTETYDAAGHMTALTRFHADGTLDYKQVMANGVSTLSSYDSKGGLLAQSVIQADSSRVVTTYAADHLHVASTVSYDAAGHLAQSVTVNADGSSTVKLAAAGLTASSSAGNDVFSSFHGDTFDFKTNFGKDVINGFNAGDGAAHDTIAMSKAEVPDFGHLVITKAGGDTLIHAAGADTITLKGVAAASLTAHDFLFH